MKVFISPGKRLAVSIVAGVFASAGVWFFLKSEKKKITEHYTLAPILSSKKYIGSGKELLPEMVEETQMPLAYLPPGALQHKADLLDAKGKARYKTRIGILKNDVIAKPKLLEASSLVGLSWILQPGQTALCLKLSAPAAVGGLLQPGDWVSVVSLMDAKSRLLLPRIRVAAVGEQVWDPAGTPTQNEISKTVAADDFLVTLILTQQEALLATLAAEKGSLVLTLASPLE